MFKRARSKCELSLYAYSLLCAFLISGCANTGGSFDLGQADAQIAQIAREYPDLAPRLVEIRAGVMSAEDELKQKEATIDRLAKVVDLEREKSQERLLLIWKLTSGILGLLLVVGIYLTWKLK